MKKLILAAIAVLGVVSIALAGTYSVTTNASQDNRLEKDRVRQNKAACSAVQLPNDCTQAQCRAKDPGCNIYSDIADLIDRKIVKNYADALKTNDTRDDQELFCSYWSTATQAQKNATCQSATLPNGCELCLN